MRAFPASRGLPLSGQGQIPTAGRAFPYNRGPQGPRPGLPKLTAASHDTPTMLAAGPLRGRGPARRQAPGLHLSLAGLLSIGMPAQYAR